METLNFGVNGVVLGKRLNIKTIQNVYKEAKMEIPVLLIRGEGLAEVWEKSLIEVYKNGIDIKTQYDKESDPPSKDCTMIMVINNPFSEPMIHKEMPCGLEDLQEYVMEVLEGIKDHCVRDQNDPNDHRWEYTYHQRLFKYDLPINAGLQSNLTGDCPIMGGILPFNQIEIMCQKIAKTPYTRRAQAVTWKVWEDNECYDPSCLQSIWCRCVENENKDLVLNTNIRFRSNDSFKAAQLNMFAFIMLQKKIADRISELSGKKVIVGRYMHEADSYHIYGSYMKEFENRFLKSLSNRSFEDRTWRYCDVKEIMDSSIPVIFEKMKTFGK